MKKEFTYAALEIVERNTLELTEVRGKNYADTLRALKQYGNGGKYLIARIGPEITVTVENVKKVKVG